MKSKLLADCGGFSCSWAVLRFGRQDKINDAEETTIELTGFVFTSSFALLYSIIHGFYTRSGGDRRTYTVVISTRPLFFLVCGEFPTTQQAELNCLGHPPPCFKFCLSIGSFFLRISNNPERIKNSCTYLYPPLGLICRCLLRSLFFHQNVLTLFDISPPDWVNAQQV